LGAVKTPFRRRGMIEAPIVDMSFLGGATRFVLARYGKLRSAELHVEQDISEVDMSNKILIAVASAILLASTGLASAQTRTHLRTPHAYAGTPYVDSYYNKSYWDAVLPNMYVRPDPLVGTVWEGIVPY
jgi:hypothetical protein